MVDGCEETHEGVLEWTQVANDARVGKGAHFYSELRAN